MSGKLDRIDRKVDELQATLDRQKRTVEILEALELTRAALSGPQERLNRIALRVGNLLLDGAHDPDWDDQQELEAAAVEYAKAMRGQR